MDLGIPLKMEEARSRNKERLEASFAWLCELEMLKQRQESLVLGALSLGDSVPGCQAWGDVGPARGGREQEQLTLRLQLVGDENDAFGIPSSGLLSLYGDVDIRAGVGKSLKRREMHWQAVLPLYYSSQVYF